MIPSHSPGAQTAGLEDINLESVVVLEAKSEHTGAVASLVERLLIELEPEAQDEIRRLGVPSVAERLLNSGKIIAFLALVDGAPAGVATLHECAAIYAGGIFGEISELYVAPEFRSRRIGQQLLDAISRKAEELGWNRIEVGSPPPDEWQRTLQFYEKNGFVSTGTRLRRLVPQT